MGRHRNQHGQRGGMSEGEAEEALNRQLTESGEREKLRSKLNRELEAAGWREQVKLQVKDIVQERGPQSVTIEELVQEMSPKATSLVPDKVRKDLMKDVARFLEKNAEH